MTDEVIATATDYPSLQQALRARADKLRLSRQALDQLAGTHEGHAGKMLADPPKKNMGITTIGLLLQALGVKLLLVEDADQMRRIAQRIVPRRENQVRMLPAAKHRVKVLRFTRRYMRKLSIAGNEARKLKLTQKRRSQIARQAANARWS